MNYEQWKDADGKYHDISGMSDDYIHFCIKQLRIVIENYRLNKENPWDKSNNPSDDEVLHRNWSIDHAIPFLKAFEAELDQRRNR